MRRLEAVELVVRVGDVNYGQHLGHDALVSLLHEARVRAFRQLGGGEQDLYGVGLIVRRLEVVYLAEAFLGEVLSVELAVSGVKGAQFSLDYQVRCAGRLVAQAQTLMVGFDYQVRRIRALPEDLRAVLLDLSGGVDE